MVLQFVRIAINLFILNMAVGTIPRNSLLNSKKNEQSGIISNYRNCLLNVLFMQILMKFGNISELSKPNELIKSKFYKVFVGLEN